MLFKKLLDKISKKSSNAAELDFECFENELNLAISILMIEVSKSDDEFSSEERDKIISLLKQQFNLDQNQIKILMCLAEEKNDEMQNELVNDDKELAEHTMLVDLGRNDIGRVCDYGTVHVKSLMEVKRFSHVQHMVTHVVGKLSKKFDMYDAFKAVFPAGTVSGAPKVRAMEIIDELEPESRGSYAGAVGYFSFNGCCDFAIAIRSIFADGKSGFVQAGAGIVFDSIAKNELNETEHKANAMITALKEASK